MLQQYTEISLTYNLGGERLAQRGVYGKNGETLVNPRYNYAKQHVNLGTAFIEKALTRPERPRRNASLREVNYYNQWLGASNKQRIVMAVVEYVKDMNGTNPEFTIQ